MDELSVNEQIESYGHVACLGCSAKAGAYELCFSCRANRDAIGQLQCELLEASALLEALCRAGGCAPRQGEPASTSILRLMARLTNGHISKRHDDGG